MLHYCVVCEKDKPRDEFYKNSNRKSGVHSRCKKCCRETAKKRKPHSAEYMKEWREKNPGKARRYYLKRVYGLTEEEFETMSKVCEICGGDHLLGVDHCHDTGAVRGILCRTCNSGIGHLRDDVELVRKAVAYLEAS